MLNYKEYGSGEPIIVLHGLLGMLDNWHSFAKKLGEDYWVISVDQRNHGKSFHSKDFDYTLLSSDLMTFLEEIHIPSCHILGHSMGGKTVMQFLNDYPGVVDKAVVVDISPKMYEGGHEMIFEALKSVDLDKVTSRKDVQDVLMESIQNIGVVNFLMKNLSRKPEGGFEWKANVQVLDKQYDSIKAGISFDDIIETPTLFIKGEKSGYINEEDEALISEQFEEAKVITIENAGHWVHADQPEALLNRVKDFLKT
jgi:pimeloyl-ACP methyl ester carboxylesterase